jgi:hypothetical protein
MDSRIDPSLFGPLSDEPVVETGPSQLFPGEDRLLTESSIRKKVELLDILKGILDGVLADGEKMLYLLPAQQQPRLMDYVGLGFWFIHLHKVALVLTDRRLIEILLDLQGRPATRIRSYSWAGAESLKLGIGKLTVKTLSGKKQGWRLPARADRKLLKQLVPNIQERIAQHGVPVPDAEEYHWHCPSCWSKIEPNPESCRSCSTRFRTTKMATLLSIAFPGAGLFYAKRPILGMLDLFGEVMLYVMLFFMLIVAAGAEEVSAAIGIVGVLILLTKLESIHVSGMMVRRTRSISDRAAANWKRAAYGGGLLSVIALVFAFASTGSLSGSIARDLDFNPPEPAWVKTRSMAEFERNDDGSQRSRWFNQESGLDVDVFAYPLEPWIGFDDFRRDYLAYLQQAGLRMAVPDAGLPAGLNGFICMIHHEDVPEEILLELTFMLWDEESHAVHHVMTAVLEEDRDAAMTGMLSLLASAEWIPAVEPE